MSDESTHPLDRRAWPAALVIIAAIALYRLGPHPWNVAPVGALFVLSGLYMGRGWQAWALPFAAVLFSDGLLYARWDGSFFHLERLVDYLAFALIVLAGRAAAKGRTASKLASVAAAPIAFYLVSNFGVWLWDAPLYPHTLAGLADCYVAAIPFFRGTLVGDWLFGLAGLAVIEYAPHLGFMSRRPQQAA